MQSVGNTGNEILFHYDAVPDMCRLCSDRFENHKCSMEPGTNQNELQ